MDFLVSRLARGEVSSWHFAHLKNESRRAFDSFQFRDKKTIRDLLGGREPKLRYTGSRILPKAIPSGCQGPIFNRDRYVKSITIFRYVQMGFLGPMATPRALS